MNLLANTPSQPSRFKTKSWIKINGKSQGTYDTGSQNRFKTSMLRSGLCDYKDVYIPVKGTIRKQLQKLQLHP